MNFLNIYRKTSKNFLTYMRNASKNNQTCVKNNVKMIANNFSLLQLKVVKYNKYLKILNQQDNFGIYL